MNKKSSLAVLERIKTVLGASSDSELCRLIGINRQTLASWKTRESVPYALCVQMSEERDLSLDWLLLGSGSMYRNDNAQSEGLNPRQTAILKLFDGMSENEQREIQAAYEEKKRLNDLEQRVAALEEFKKNSIAK